MEVAIRPKDDAHALVVARYEPLLSSGSEITDPTTGFAWSSLGFKYNDMHTGRSRTGRDMIKVSMGTFDETNPAYRSLPLESRAIHMSRAVTVCLNAKNLPGEKLWEAELAMNGLFPDQDTLLCMVKMSPSVSTKRMTRATQQTSHSIIAYPNASGCVTLTAPGAWGKSGDLDKMSKVSDLIKKSVKIKSYHTVTKALTYIEASLSNRVELSGFKDESSLRVLEDDIFSIGNIEAFDSGT